ncbi:hypothetical protein CF319_g9361, partial [Tilletia indica]
VGADLGQNGGAGHPAAPTPHRPRARPRAGGAKYRSRRSHAFQRSRAMLGGSKETFKAFSAAADASTTGSLPSTSNT